MVLMEYLLKILSLYETRSQLVNELLLLHPDRKLSNTHIANWIERDDKVPAHWVISLSKVCGYQFTPHQIAPDLYPHPDDGLPAHLRSRRDP